MRLALCLALLLFPQNPSSEIRFPDLEAMLQKDEALQGLLIAYWAPVQKGWNQTFFVRGDGTVIKQSAPDRPMPVADIPTCTEHISVERTKALVQLITQKRFFAMPDRQFIVMNGPLTNEEFEIHTIGVSDGVAKTRRSFGIGRFAGKKEVIPPEFTAIENELKQIRDSAFPPHGKDCHFSPAIKF